jgi:predicted Fe-Mo cluster-binding NifX family protein
MKICVTSTGRDLSARSDIHFGRSPYFLIVDTDTMEFNMIKNAAQVSGRGWGISAAQLILDKGATAVLTGILGPNAFRALSLGHVEIYEGLSGNDTVREAVEKFKKGEYHKATEPTGVPGRGKGFRGERC